jgi:hypothetical protein
VAAAPIPALVFEAIVNQPLLHTTSGLCSGWQYLFDNPFADPFLVSGQVQSESCASVVARAEELTDGVARDSVQASHADDDGVRQCARLQRDGVCTLFWAQCSAYG